MSILVFRTGQIQSLGKTATPIIHLLDRTETNIIFIWSGKVILDEAKPSKYDIVQ